MDRRFTPDGDAAGGDRGGEPVLPSRAGPMADCRRAIGRGRGPVLLTGEAGSGKSWLWRHLADSETGPGRWLGIDAAPSDDGLALVRRALRGLGRADLAPGPDPRAAMADELAEQSQDGRRWVLVLDEAQNAPDAALEEFRLLSNRLGHPDGFDGLVLVGRTGLALRIRDRAWASLESRLAALVQLGPIDAEEAASLLRWSLPGRSWDRSQVEAMHARTLGNPARLIRLADRTVPRPEPRPRPSPSPVKAPVKAPTPPPARWTATPGPVADRPTMPEPVGQAPRAAPSRVETAAVAAPRLGEIRPPLRFEEGLIEVGWAGIEEVAPEQDAPSAVVAPLGRIGPDLDLDLDDFGASPAAALAPLGPTTEAIDDPYAAIQARSEWSLAVESVRPDDLDDDDGEDDLAGTIEGDGEGVGPRRAGQVRAEAGQEFAPYSRLFSQLNSASDAD